MPKTPKPNDPEGAYQFASQYLALNPNEFKFSLVDSFHIQFVGTWKYMKVQEDVPQQGEFLYIDHLPNNPVDKKAISVHRGNRKQVGYLPKRKATPLFEQYVASSLPVGQCYIFVGQVWFGDMKPHPKMPGKHYFNNQTVVYVIHINRTSQLMDKTSQPIRRIAEPSIQPVQVGSQVNQGSQVGQLMNMMKTTGTIQSSQSGKPNNDFDPLGGKTV